MWWASIFNLYSCLRIWPWNLCAATRANHSFEWKKKERRGGGGGGACVGRNFLSNKVQRTKRNLKTVYVVKVSDFDSSNVEMVGFGEWYGALSRRRPTGILCDVLGHEFHSQITFYAIKLYTIYVYGKLINQSHFITMVKLLILHIM